MANHLDIYMTHGIIWYLSFELITLEDRENALLSRREIKAVIKNSAGKIKRIDASEMLAKQLKIDKENVVPISISCKTGLPDTVCSFYIYRNSQDAEKQLPRFRVLRNMPRPERKRIMDEEKAAKLKAKQAAAADKGGKRK